MKNFRMIFLPDVNKKKCIFTNINISELSPPVVITREKPIEEEVVFNSRKKSEILEYESEEYKKLKNKESCPLFIEDVDQVSFTGKLQNLNSNSCYFTFVREGENIYITPIHKWYRFTQKFNVNSDINSEDITKITFEKNKIEDDYESDKEEIDFDDVFEDDDGEDYNFEIHRTKKLTKTGKKLRNLVESLEKSENFEDESEIEEKIKREKSLDIKKTNLLTYEDIKGYFSSSKMSVKELIRKLKTNFELNEEDKHVLKKFINENCKFETNNNGEKLLILRK